MRAIALLLLCMTVFAAFAQTPEETFAEANKAYAEQRYEQAARLYQQLVDENLSSFELYYNLGNAYYKLDDVGRSVLYYEKALRLEPSNEDAQFNLDIANLKVADRVQPLREAFLFRWVNNALLTYASDGWARLALAALWLALVAGAIFLFVNQLTVKRLLFALGSLLLLVSVVLGLVALRQMDYEQTNREGIIMVMNTYVKSAPDAQSMDLFILREGVKVRLQDTADGWQQVKVVDESGDKVGWIKAEEVSPI